MQSLRTLDLQIFENAAGHWSDRNGFQRGREIARIICNLTHEAIRHSIG